MQLLYKAQHCTENEWVRFRTYFENVHPDFFLTQKKRCDMLSENELKYCALILVGLDSKQIAQMQNVAHQSVIKARYRIRKKLGLEGEESLDHFLRSLKYNDKTP